MLDIKFVRDNQEAVAEAMKNRHASWDAARFSELDETRRAAIAKEEALQAERNATSKSIGQMMAAGQKDEAEAAKQRVRAINDELAVIGKDREAADEALREVLLRTPNMPADSTPVGDDEDDNPEVRRWGAPRDFAAEGFEMKPHWDLGPELGIIDFERAVKLAASRFILLGGLGARLERASSTSWPTRTRRAATRNGGARPWPTPRRSPAPASCRSSRKTCSTPPRACTSSPRPRCS